MAVRFELRQIMLLVILVLLVSCGGSGGGGGSTAATNPPPASLPPLTGKELVPQQISVVPPNSLGSGDTLKLVSAFTGTSDLLTTADTPIDRYEIGELAIVLNQNDEIAMMGFLTPSGPHSITPTTTAVTLLAIYPSLANAYISDPEAFVTTVQDFLEVRELAAAIDMTSDWSTTSDSEFLEVAAAAVIRVQESIVSNLPTSSVDPNGYQSKVNIVGAELKSEVSLGLSSETTQTNNPEFKVTVVNAANRYVSMVVGDANLDQTPRQFLVRPEIEEAFFYSTEILVGGNSIYAYGPGVNNLPMLPEAVNAYTEAGIASLIEYDAIPTLKARWGFMDPNCLKNKWFVAAPDGSLRLSSPFNTNLQLYSAPLLINDYFSAKLLVVQALENFRHRDIVECVQEAASLGLEDSLSDSLIDFINDLFVALQPLDSLISAIGNNVVLSETFGLDPQLSAAINASEKAEQWSVDNSQLYNQNNFSVTVPAAASTMYVPDPCNDQEVCLGFQFPRVRPEQPFSVTFNVTCVDNLGVEALCRNVVFDFGDGESVGGTKESPTEPPNGDGSSMQLSHDYPFREANPNGTVPQYEGTVSAADYDGAYVDHKFVLDLVEQVPSIVVLVDDVEYQEGINNIFECTVGENATISKTIQIKNIGLGTLYLDGPGRPGPGTGSIGGGFSISSAFEGAELATQAKSAPRTLSYDCTAGSRNSDRWRYTFIDYHSSSYDFPVEFKVVVEDALFASLPGTWYVGQDLYSITPRNPSSCQSGYQAERDGQQFNVIDGGHTAIVELRDDLTATYVRRDFSFNPDGGNCSESFRDPIETTWGYENSQIYLNVFPWNRRVEVPEITDRYEDFWMYDNNAYFLNYWDRSPNELSP